ncbi:Piwi-like protein 2, partial [Leptotrombidium deliense]
MTKKKEESSSNTSSSAETSPSSGSATEGAVGGEPSSPAPEPEKQKGFQAIRDKQRGTDGRVMDVAVNYIRLKRKEDTSIYEYSVFFEPQIDAIKLRRFLFRNPEVKEVIGEIYEFTGQNVFLPIQLPDDTTEISTRSTHNNMDVIMTLKYVKQPPPEEMVPFFNTMFRRIMRQLRLVQINRHYYDPNAKIEIPVHKLEVWPGVVTSILDFDGGLMLNCDISHRVLRTSTALHVLKDILNQPDGRARFEELSKKRLEGCIVLTRYNNKPYRIDEVKFDITPKSEFTLSNGQKVTYLDYFKRHWNIEIRDPNQPML